MKIINKNSFNYLIGKVFVNKNYKFHRKIVGYAIDKNINDIILICESDDPVPGVSSTNINSLIAYHKCEIREFQSDESINKYYSLIYGIKELNNNFIEIKDEDTTQNR